MATYVPYKNRPEWADITPIPQNDGPAPVVRIAYTKEFEETMGYLRAIMFKDERSERALELTAAAIELNAAHYTCWHFRRLVLAALGSDLEAELDYVAEVAAESPKNYQVWYHRQAVVEMWGSAVKELGFTARVLDEDAKNYHCWAHRQWAIMTFDLFADELEYVERLLNEDVRNNSAWNQRYFTVTRGGKCPWTRELVDAEVAFAWSKIRTAPNNEAAWNYLDGVLENQTAAAFPADFAAVRTQVDEFLAAFVVCVPARSFLVRMCSLSGVRADLERAVVLCTELGESLDTIRTKYWAHRKGQLLARLAA
eukprot:c12742_g1_i1.p1 GENE.c12742_g1_i1~~c12742_g1_i1.p1  ORF type:complete len:323 (-),score=64.62 c12742_g1_i1:131-1063(-)